MVLPLDYGELSFLFTYNFFIPGHSPMQATKPNMFSYMLVSSYVFYRYLENKFLQSSSSKMG